MVLFQLGLELCRAKGGKPSEVATLARWATELDFPALDRALSAHKQLSGALGADASIQKHGRADAIAPESYEYIRLLEIGTELEALSAAYAPFEAARA